MKGHTATQVFSAEHLRLLASATRFVELVPEGWNIRSHELVRAIAEGIRTHAPSPLTLTVQDGVLGSEEHSWLWVGPPPEPVLCTFPGLGQQCEWEGVFEVNRENLRDDFGGYVSCTYCTMHTNAVCESGTERQPILRNTPILDCYLPGAVPQVALLNPYPTKLLYCPGPPRTDINQLLIHHLQRLFLKHRQNLCHTVQIKTL